MKVLKEITEDSLGISGDGALMREKYTLRFSARAVLMNNEGLMALQYLPVDNYHKLPGGGVEQGESREEGLLREIKEEVGCDAEILSTLGMTIEYRNQYEPRLLHIAYGYLARVRGEIGDPAYEQGEIDAGQETVWLTPEVALQKIQSDRTDGYKGKFIIAREEAFLVEALSQMKI